jgi:hypothetical protein
LVRARRDDRRGLATGDLRPQPAGSAHTPARHQPRTIRRLPRASDVRAGTGKTRGGTVPPPSDGGFGFCTRVTPSRLHLRSPRRMSIPPPRCLMRDLMCPRRLKPLRHPRPSRRRTVVIEAVTVPYPPGNPGAAEHRGFLLSGLLRGASPGGSSGRALPPTGGDPGHHRRACACDGVQVRVTRRPVRTGPGCRKIRRFQPPGPECTGVPQRSSCGSGVWLLAGHSPRLLRRTRGHAL